MERKIEKKRGNYILLIIMGILILSEIIVNVINLLSGYGQTVNSICIILDLVFTALYGFWFYKKPHGNMLKYAMLIYAASFFLVSCECLIKNYEYKFIYIIYIFIGGMVCYVAGRLERIKQNKYMLLLATAIVIVLTIIVTIKGITSLNIIQILRRLSGAISLTTILIAYLTRYKEHKEAGLEDAPKN